MILTASKLVLRTLLAIAALLCVNVHAATVYQSIPACARALQTPATTSLHKLPVPLRLRSWNIMKFDLPGAQDVLAHLSINADLVLLQESMRGMDTSLNAGNYRYFSPGYARGSEETGVEIRSNVAADVVCELRFTEPWLRTPKAISALRLPFEEVALLLINLHAINFTLSARDYAIQLAELSMLVRSHRGAVIVAGDFNHWNPWRAAALNNWAAGLALNEVVFELDWRSRHLGSTVDTIFLRGLRAISTAALPTTRSDHNPVSASLLLLKNSPRAAADNRAQDALPAPTR